MHNIMCIVYSKLYEYVLSVLAEIGRVGFWSKRPKGRTRVAVSGTQRSTHT